jgi:L-histidine Nalpha-methyltransferase
VPTSVQSRLSPFAQAVAEGFSAANQKRINPRYFYDDLGSCLFEAITYLPEYGLTRADERLLRVHSRELASLAGPLAIVAELGSGSGKKTVHVLRAALEWNQRLVYRPIDVSTAALTFCENEIGVLCDVESVCADWMQGLSQIADERADSGPLLLLFLGSSIGNLDRDVIPHFLTEIRSHLKPGDFFLLGADLVKDVSTMILAYDDPTGVTAAFNLNMLGRINRELEGNFDLRSFAHEARWDPGSRRIEMHLLSRRDQRVYIGSLDTSFEFQAGETIWTESSHKFGESELDMFARSGGFTPVVTWIDSEWPFAEALWRVTE